MNQGNIVVYTGKKNRPLLGNSYLYVILTGETFALVFTLSDPNTVSIANISKGDLEIVGNILPPLTVEQLDVIVEKNSIPDDLRDKLSPWTQPRG